MIVQFGGAQWVAGYEFGIGTSLNQMVFYKSIDSGATWTRVAALSNANWDEVHSIVWDRNDSWVLVTAKNGVGIQFWRFTMSGTPGWGSSPFSTIPITNYGTDEILVSKANGLGISRTDLNVMAFVYLDRLLVTPFTWTEYYVYTTDGGATWSVPVQIGAGIISGATPAAVTNVMFDNAGICHCVMDGGTSFQHFAVHYVQIDATGALVVDATPIASVGPVDAAGWNDALYDPFANKLYITELIQNFSAPNQVNVLRATITAGSAPAITRESLYIGTSGGSNAYMLFARSQTENYSSRLIVLVSDGPGLTDEGIVMWDQHGGGSWTQQILWDMGITPPTMPPGKSLNAVEEATGTLIGTKLQLTIGGIISPGFYSSSQLVGIANDASFGGNYVDHAVPRNIGFFSWG